MALFIDTKSSVEKRVQKSSILCIFRYFESKNVFQFRFDQQTEPNRLLQ